MEKVLHLLKFGDGACLARAVMLHDGGVGIWRVYIASGSCLHHTLQGMLNLAHLGHSGWPCIERGY